MKTLIVILTTLLAAGMNAQQFSCETASCTTHEAGKYNIELAGCNNYLDIYVYNLEMQPVRNLEITGYVEFHYPDESILKAEFRQYFRTNSLRARIVGPGFYNCRITLFIDGEVISTVFDNECDLRADAKTILK